ncbi:hypothetical protein CTAYLR_003035 [Chrysophaeum taylorii]|uniref:PNPLA domain-containing protein n=1 Tax=Chrysophaeum taylorii TaxID=2483200 RepID=A0AAD7XHD1_9STRA|nr:hypothetical protein CTAYLR_003035 [Chrysophaeum taylorii]
MTTTTTLREWLCEEKFAVAVSQGLLCESASLGAVIALDEAFEGGLRERVTAVSGASSGAKIAAIIAQKHVSLDKAATELKNAGFKDIFRAAWMKHGHIEDLLERVWGAGKTFEDCDIPFATTAFDLRTFRSVTIDRGNLASACQASGAFPGIFRPKKRGDHLFWDLAGFTDPAGVRGARVNTRLLQIAHADWNLERWLVLSPAKFADGVQVCSIVFKNHRRLIPLPCLFSKRRAALALEEAKEAVTKALDRPLCAGDTPGHFLCYVGSHENHRTPKRRWRRFLLATTLLGLLVLAKRRRRRRT